MFWPLGFACKHARKITLSKAFLNVSYDVLATVDVQLLICMKVI